MMTEARSLYLIARYQKSILESKRRCGAAKKSDIENLHTARVLYQAIKQNPNWASQPRVPAGNPDGGQWTDGGGSSGDSAPKPLRRH